MKDQRLYVCIIDISLNLARIGNWTADAYEQKKPLIQHFLQQTDQYVQTLKYEKMNRDIEITFKAFQNGLPC